MDHPLPRPPPGAWPQQPGRTHKRRCKHEQDQVVPPSDNRPGPGRSNPEEPTRGGASMSKTKWVPPSDMPPETLPFGAVVE